MEKRYLFRVLDSNNEPIEENDFIVNPFYCDKDKAFEMYRGMMITLGYRNKRIICDELTMEQYKELQNVKYGISQ